MFLSDLAAAYDDLSGPPGIPWSGLLANGHGITENGYDPAYMDFMLKAGSDFYGVIGSLSEEFVQKYRHLRADEGRASVTRLMAIIDQMGADVWEAVKDADWDAFVALPKTTTIDAFATIAANAGNGAFLHYDGVMEAAMRAGKVSPEEVMQHATSVTKCFQTFVDLDKNGHFAEFKKVKPVAGMGMAPAIIAAIAAVGIVLVIGLCYLFYVVQLAAPAQKKALEWCDKVAKEGTKEDAMACVNAATNMQKNSNLQLANVFGTAIAPLVTVLAIGAGFYFLPIIIAQFRKAKSGGA